MAKSDYLTVIEFAKIVKVDSAPIYYALKKGKLTAKLIDGVRKISKKKGLEQWEQNIDKIAQAKGRVAKKKKKEDIKDLKTPTYDGLTMADAERQDKVYKARLSQLKYLEQAGKLIKVEDVQLQAFETGRKVRDAILSISPRIAHELAAETDPHTLETKLNKEMIDAFERVIGEQK